MEITLFCLHAPLFPPFFVLFFLLFIFSIFLSYLWWIECAVAVQCSLNTLFLYKNLCVHFFLHHSLLVVFIRFVCFLLCDANHSWCWFSLLLPIPKANSMRASKSLIQMMCSGRFTVPYTHIYTYIHIYIHNKHKSDFAFAFYFEFVLFFLTFCSGGGAALHLFSVWKEFSFARFKKCLLFVRSFFLLLFLTFLLSITHFQSISFTDSMVQPKQVVESQLVLLRKLFNHSSSICKFNRRKKNIRNFMNEFDFDAYNAADGFFSHSFRNHIIYVFDI